VEMMIERTKWRVRTSDFSNDTDIQQLQKR